MRKFLTLRFSGCGHLLPYHLGVSLVLLEEESKVAAKLKKTASIGNIKAVSGSSAGAIAAVMHARLPDRIEEFAMKFISDRGHAFKTLTAMLHEDENSQNLEDCSQPSSVITNGNRTVPPSLHIGTTRCVDKSSHTFHFSGCVGQYSSISTSWTTDKILDAVKASCTIPQSFHPADIVFENGSSYPDTCGIVINGDYHVDGGIAAPGGPITPRDDQEGACPIIVSPISVGAPFFFNKGIPTPIRISPVDDSWRLLPISNLTCRGGFDVKPSIQNLKALRMSSGLVSSAELENWYRKGISDALKLVNEWETRLQSNDGN